MTALAIAPLFVGLLVLPLLALICDLVPLALVSRHRADGAITASTVEDFTVIVPIYGKVEYLENVDYLSRYGSRVMLATTAGESSDFYERLRSIAELNDFAVFVSDYRPPVRAGRRQTGGVTRDSIVRSALKHVETEYVLCIDADTRTERPLQELVGALAAKNLELASVRLVVSNRTTLLSKWQAHEYRMSMRMRYLMPWLCSGACHLGRTTALRHIMDEHSLFFQGNDAELGLLGQALGYRIGHLSFAVPTAVPERPAQWLRQRFAWAGGEFRLYVVNARMVLRHPWFILYGALLVFALAPMRVFSAIHPGWLLLAVLGLYWVVVLLANRKYFDGALLLYPAYGLVNSLLLAPLGLVSYALMALRSRNSGLIRFHPTRKVAQRRTA